MGNFFKTVICVLVALFVLAGAAFWGLAGLMPAVDIEDSLRPDAASQYFDDKGELLYTTASEERRIPVSLDKMPKHLQEAFISIEDARFYEHGGIDIRGTARALFVTLTGGDVQGGSTITQQLAKNAFLTNERTITRKIKEAFIARQLEERYTKDEILNMYLNRIYFGQGTCTILANTLKTLTLQKQQRWQPYPKALTTITRWKTRRPARNVRSLFWTRW